MRTLLKLEQGHLKTYTLCGMILLQATKLMTERNLTQELLYTYYEDRENGDDVESIDYRSLIHSITELCDRIEKLEKVNKENLSLLNLVEKGQ